MERQPTPPETPQHGSPERQSTWKAIAEIGKRIKQRVKRVKRMLGGKTDIFDAFELERLEMSSEPEGTCEPGCSHCINAQFGSHSSNGRYTRGGGYHGLPNRWD